MPTGILASLSVEIGAEISGFQRGVATAKKELAGLVKAGQAAQSIGQTLSTYVTAPLLLAGAASLKMGGDFQAAFNRVEAATQASGTELDALRKKAQGIALDPKLQFSSVQAAQALEALAKNGLSTAQILGGAADASTALATATGGTLATAADITTDVMNNFGKSAAQAAALVSNITGTTIASKFGIDDYRLALGQAGAVASQMGISFEDFNTALGVTSSGFSSGQDAGTSFKTFVQRLVPQSKEAAAAIEQLGLNFFDAQGKMRPLREIAGQLQQAFKGLSDQQKNALGSKIFGSDAIRTALLLAKEGAEGFDKMAESIGKVDAAAQGGILNKGFTGAFEAFKSSVEGAAQAIAESGILDFATQAAQVGASLAASVATADPALLKFGVGLAAAAAAVGPLLVAVGSLGVALPFVEAGFVALTGPIGIAVGAIALLGVGFAAVVANSKDATTEFTKQRDSVNSLEKSVNPLLTRYDELKAKATLNKAEQEELRRIIEKVGQQIPTSISAFDAYGKALDINSDKARAFVKTQQEIAEQAKKPALTEQRARFKELTQQIEATTAALRRVDAQGNIVRTNFDRDVDNPFDPTEINLTGDEILALQAKLDNLRTARRGVGGLIDQLKGIVPVVKEINATGGVVPPLTPATTAKTQEEVEKTLRALQKLNEGYKNIGARTTKGLAPKDAPEFIELNIPKASALPTELQKLPGFDTSEQAATVELARQNYQKLSDAEKLAFLNTQVFNTQMETAFDNLSSNIGPLLADFAGQFGEAFGSLIVGTVSAGNALATLFAGVLGSLASFMGDFGKQLVAIGIGKLALDSLFTGPQGGPLAIAAGVGLIALAGVASAVAKNAASSLGSASNGGSARTYNPVSSTATQVPVQRIEIELKPVTFRQKGPDLESVVGVNKYRRQRLS